MGKGSITIFVIIGLIIIVSISFVMLNIPQGVIPQTEDLSSEKTNTKYYIDTCLDLTTIQAVELFGFNSETAVASYVDSNLIDCVGNFSFIKDYNIEFGKPKSTVIINKNVVFVDLNFPIEIKKENTKVELEEFQYSLKRLSIFKIDDMIPAGTSFFSSDKNLVATIEQDTQAKDKTGKNIGVLSFNLLDKNFDGLSNGVVLGNIVYEGLPSGAVFNPPLKITIALKKQDLPNGYPKEGPQIAWYDKEGDIWRTYPSIGFDEDENYYYYSAEVSHFTPMAIVTCGIKPEGESNVPDSIEMGYVFRSLITPMDNNYWKDNKEEGFHIIPEVMGNASCFKDYLTEIGETEESIGMKFNFDGECSELVKDWDKDDEDNYHNCALLAKESIECYFSNVNCESKETFLKNPADNPNWIYSPEEKALISGDYVKDYNELDCTKADAVIPIIFSDISVANDKIKYTMEGDDFFATPKTYGYPDLESVGGSGKFIIQLASEGDSCVDSWGIVGKDENLNLPEGKTNNLDGAVGICSEGDTCTWKMINLEGNEISTELNSGDNILHVEVENLIDWKAYASGFLKFNGEGIEKIETKGIGGSSGISGSGMGGELGGGSGQYYDMAAGDFQEIFPGIELKKVDSTINPEIELPGPLVYYVAKIDLTRNPNFFVTPPNPSLMQTSSFLAEYASSQNLVLAVNGGGFEYGGGNENIGGYAVSSGVVYSSAEYEPEEATVVISKDNKAGFFNDFEAYHAVSGFQAVVIDGETRGVHTPGHPDYKPEKGYDILHPRTSIGIDKDNNIMYIIVVDGRSSSSVGVSTVDLGKIHVHHGSTYAVNLDGGGSSTMVINQANTALIVNTPSDPGGERAVANHFGVGVKEGASLGSSLSGELGGGATSTGSSAAPSMFRVVASGVAAGGQPSAAEFAWLKEEGYTTIIDVSTEDSTEPSTVALLGINYVPLALGGYITEIPPYGALYDKLDYVVSLMDQGNVYIHCKWGVHRTGIALAAYRIKHGMSNENALSLYKSEGGSAVNLYPYIFDIILNYPI